MCSSQSPDQAASLLALPLGECHFPYFIAVTLRCQEHFVYESEFLTFVYDFIAVAVLILLDSDDFIVYNLKHPVTKEVDPCLLIFRLATSGPFTVQKPFLWKRAKPGILQIVLPE
jgi:hypothetical protein